MKETIPHTRILQMEKDENLAVHHVTPSTVEYVVQKIVQTTHPREVILFGSQARGDQCAGSDIDILVVTNPGEDREKVRLAVERALRGRRFDIHLLVRTPEDIAWNIDAENPFYTEDILNQGRVMYRIDKGSTGYPLQEG